MNNFQSTSCFSVGLVGPAPSSVRWTCLMLDLKSILSTYLSRCYSHVKTIKLCANMVVKNVFTSDLLFNPGNMKLDRIINLLDLFCLYSFCFDFGIVGMCSVLDCISGDA